jgi:hypothetical protein
VVQAPPRDRHQFGDRQGVGKAHRGRHDQQEVPRRVLDWRERSKRRRDQLDPFSGRAHPAFPCEVCPGEPSPNLDRSSGETFRSACEPEGERHFSRDTNT